MIKQIKCPICGQPITITDRVSCDHCHFTLAKAMGVDIDTYDAVQLINGNPIVIKNHNRTTGHEFCQEIRWNGETTKGTTGVTFLQYDCKYVSDADYAKYQSQKREEMTGQPTERTQEICANMDVTPFLIKVMGDTPDAVIAGDIFDGKTVKESAEFCKYQDKADDHTMDVIMAAMYQMTTAREAKTKNYTMQGRIQDVLNTYACLLRDILTPLRWMHGVTPEDIVRRSADERGVLVLRLLYTWIHNLCWIRSDLVIDAKDNITNVIADLITSEDRKNG